MSLGFRFRNFCFTMLAGALLLHAQGRPVVVSAADATAAAAPGSLATMYGVQLNTGPLQPGGSGEVSTELGGFSVEVNGKRAQLLFLSSVQINFVMPADATAGEATVTVKLAGQVVAEAKTTVKAVSPAIFSTVRAGVEMGAILNAVTFTGGPFSLDTAVNTGCDKRTRLAIFATGLGLAAKRVTAADIQVETQDLTGARSLFAAESAGAVSGFVGLDQVNIVLPSGMAAGMASVRIFVGGAVSNKVNFEVAARVGAPPSGLCLAGVSLAPGPASGQFTGTVTLAYPAPAGGATVSLSADGNVGISSSVTVPEGQISAQFQVAASVSAGPQTVHVMASLNGEVRVASLDIGSPALACIASISISGNTGTVRLTAPAPSGGLVVNLQSSDTIVQVASQVTVPAGQTSANFNVSIGSVSVATQATISASAGACGGVSVGVTVNPPAPACVASVSVSAGTVIGGNSLTGTVNLSAPAPAGGLVVNLQSSNSSVQVAGPVTVPAGQTSANFSVNTSNVSAATQANISASTGNCGSVSVGVTVNPPTGASCIASVSVPANAMIGGTSATGTVRLTAPAPTGGLLVTLTSSDPSVQISGQVNIPAGQFSANFIIYTTGVLGMTEVTISASAGTCGGASVAITVNPSAPPCVSGLSLSAGSLIGGLSATGTVTLTGAALSGGLIVNLQSSDSHVQVPASVTVAAGRVSGSFVVSTTPVLSGTTAVVRASGACGTESASITVQPTVLTNLTLSANVARGGTDLTGTVTLSGPAPAGGIVVNLRSNSELVTVPASVTVPAGQISATFSIGTSVTLAPSAATVTASFGESVKTASIAIQPPL